MEGITGAFLERRVPPRFRVAAGLSCLAGLVSLISYAGWLFDVPALRDFGHTSYPAWPLTALCFLFLTAAMLCRLTDKGQRYLIPFLIPPVAIALLAMFDAIAGLQSDLWTRFFPDLVSASAGTNVPGRPGSLSVVTILLLATGLAATRSKRPLARETILLIGSAAIGVSITGAALLLIADQAAGQHRIGALPSCISGALLAFVLIYAQSREGPGWFFGQREPQTAMQRAFLPLIVTLPMVPVLLELVLRRMDLLAQTEAEVMIVTGNMLIVASLILWAMSQLGRQRETAVELSHALDTADLILATGTGTITHWSLGAQRLYGWTPREAIGSNRYLLTRARCEMRSKVGPPIGGKPDEHELIEHRRDGSEICVLERLENILTPGRAPMVVHKVADITDRVRAEEAMRSSEERLLAATEAHDVGVFEWEVDSGTIHWSPGAEQRLGRWTGAISSFEDWADAVVPEDRDAVLETIADAVANRGERFSFRYRLFSESGSVRAVEGSARCFYDVEGNLLRTVGAVQDTTEREAQETELRAREAELRSIIETVPDALVTASEDGLILKFSAASERLWGYDAAMVLGQPLHMLFCRDDQEEFDALVRSFETGDSGETVLRNARSREGRDFPVEIRLGRAQTETGATYSLFLRDISQRISDEERFGELNAELAHVSRQSAMSELAADLAHELNQPLAATANFLAAGRMLLERDGDRQRVVEFLQMANEQTVRAGEIIRRLRNFIAKREVEMHLEPLDQLIRDAVALVLVGTGQFDLRLNYDFDPRARVVFVDRVQIQQVLVNLLRNAIEALRGRPVGERQITVATAQREEGMVEVSLTDTGPGIPEPVLKQIYTRFSTTKGDSGMGIGLSICKRIVEAHGGTLTAENRREGGACFRFTLTAIEEME